MVIGNPFQREWVFLELRVQFCEFSYPPSINAVLFEVALLSAAAFEARTPGSSEEAPIIP